MVPARPALRVLVADDKPLGAALVTALGTGGELSCVGRVTRLEDVAEHADRHGADVVLLDCLLGGATALHVVGELAARRPETMVLVLSEVASESLARESLRRGAVGFLVHSGHVDTLLPRIRACTGRAPAEHGADALA
jgi:DNA-binding NarL/FixJ family response regulator